MLIINSESGKNGKFNWDLDYNPLPGMLGTMYCGSDSYVIVCISNDTQTRITLCTLYGLDEYNIKDNPDISIDDEGVMWIDLDKYKKYHPSNSEHWSRRKNGKWKEMNKSFSSGIHWGIGKPHQSIEY